MTSLADETRVPGGGRRSALGAGYIAMLALSSALIEALTLVAVWRLSLPVYVYLAVHAVVVLGLWAAIRRDVAHQRDVTVLMLIALSTLVLGPMGALLSGLASMRLAMGPRETPGLLQAWYDRIGRSLETDLVRELCDQVAIGRSMDLNADVPPSFATVLQTGSLHEKQVALGLIARNFHPDYLPPLQTALSSPEPVIRAQAAAVAAHVRGLMGQRVSAARARLATVGGYEATKQPVDLGLRLKLAQDAHDLKACVASGLMDETDRQAAVRMMPELIGTAPPMPADLLSALGSLRRDAALEGAGLWPEREAKLMAERRFGQVRLGRRLLRLLRQGPYKVRRRAKSARPRATTSLRPRRHRRTLLQLAFSRQAARL